MLRGTVFVLAHDIEFTLILLHGFLATLMICDLNWLFVRVCYGFAKQDV